MADADEYRRCANECMRLADTANNIEVKTRLLKQAYGWFEVAFQHLRAREARLLASGLEDAAAKAATLTVAEPV
jgi:hypothetical protein